MKPAWQITSPCGSKAMPGCKNLLEYFPLALRTTIWQRIWGQGMPWWAHMNSRHLGYCCDKGRSCFDVINFCTGSQDWSCLPGKWWTTSFSAWHVKVVQIGVLGFIVSDGQSKQMLWVSRLNHEPITRGVQMYCWWQLMPCCCALIFTRSDSLFPNFAEGFLVT